MLENTKYSIWNKRNYLFSKKNIRSFSSFQIYYKTEIVIHQCLATFILHSWGEFWILSVAAAVISSLRLAISECVLQFRHSHFWIWAYSLKVCIRKKDRRPDHFAAKKINIECFQFHSRHYEIGVNSNKGFFSGLIISKFLSWHKWRFLHLVGTLMEHFLEICKEIP